MGRVANCHHINTSGTDSANSVQPGRKRPLNKRDIDTWDLFQFAFQEHCWVIDSYD